MTGQTLEGFESDWLIQNKDIRPQEPEDVIDGFSVADLTNYTEKLAAFVVEQIVPDWERDGVKNAGDYPYQNAVAEGWNGCLAALRKNAKALGVKVGKE